jgi:hypothetical protein
MLITHVGGKESNSFISLNEADALIEQLPDDPTEWENLEDTQKEYRLVIAANVLGMLQLRGWKCYEGQALCFPRTSQLAGTRGTIPESVKLAQLEIAYNVVHRALNTRPDLAEGPINPSRVTQVSLGGLLSVAFSGDSAKAGTFLDSLVKSASFTVYARLKPWIAQIRGRVVGNLKGVTLSTTTTTVTETTTTTT